MLIRTTSRVSSFQHSTFTLLIMDIRQATVRFPHRWLHPIDPSLMVQVDDLLGMQNANLLNLPENYTLKYCTFNVWSLHDSELTPRSLSRPHMARIVICRRGSPGTRCWIHPGKDVKPDMMCEGEIADQQGGGAVRRTQRPCHLNFRSSTVSATRTRQQADEAVT